MLVYYNNEESDNPFSNMHIVNNKDVAPSGNCPPESAPLGDSMKWIITCGK